MTGLNQDYPGVLAGAWFVFPLVMLFLGLWKWSESRVVRVGVIAGVLVWTLLTGMLIQRGGL